VELIVEPSARLEVHERVHGVIEISLLEDRSVLQGARLSDRWGVLLADDSDRDAGQRVDEIALDLSAKTRERAVILSDEDATCAAGALQDSVSVIGNDRTQIEDIGLDAAIR
jgi:hypothetical protein